jgi:hypothetical protein
VPVIQPELSPDQSKYDASDPDLREAAQLLQQGLNAPNVEQEEAAWTKIIDRCVCVYVGGVRAVHLALRLRQMAAALYGLVPGRAGALAHATIAGREHGGAVG